MSLRPVEVYGLNVPVGEGSIPAVAMNSYPCTFRLTMAAIDPTAELQVNGEAGASPGFVGATLKMIRIPNDEDDEDDEDYDMDMANLLNDEDSDEEDDSDLDEDINGGPSDPEKSPAKARRKAALEQFKNELMNGMDVDDEDDEDGQGKMSLKAKGKAKALADEDDDSEDDSEDSAEPEEFVLCTLDTNKAYQQPLDITINEHETVYFSATGTHNIYLTGNILIPEGLTPDEMYGSDDDEEDEVREYDLSPDEDELELPDDEDESDALDDMSDPRIEELDDDESDVGESVPQLVNGTSKSKNKNKKRPAEDSDEEDAELGMSLDELISQTKGDDSEQKLSKNQLKKQRKKVKSNEGKAVEATSTVTADGKGVSEKVAITKQNAGKPDKKVQFAKTLVQGPTSSSSPTPGASALKGDSKGNKTSDATPKANGVDKAADKTKASGDVKNVGGVSIDDRKKGSGPAAKKGDKVSLRYIGKLEKDKRVFDSNKKGKPFTFKLGASEVIKGWDVGVVGMAVGGERRITIPPHLAYGSKALPDIPANSTLVFDLKLLEVK